MSIAAKWDEKLKQLACAETVQPVERTSLSVGYQDLRALVDEALELERLRNSSGASDRLQSMEREFVRVTGELQRLLGAYAHLGERLVPDVLVRVLPGSDHDRAVFERTRQRCLGVIRECHPVEPTIGWQGARVAITRGIQALEMDP